MLFSLTVGKVDAGVAVLLTQDKRLIEFPSILLPPNISSGSIVDITVSRNLQSEAESQAAFAALQADIYRTFGQRSPSPPVLRCRNATQTSVLLEWDPIQLATAELRSLSLYRNGTKAGTIPKPLEAQSTKISGLAINTEYTFHLVLRTSAGTYSSTKLAVRTHKMTDLSGITVTPGPLPAPLRQSLERAIERIGGKMVDTVRIDTTHFVCTEGKGAQWERAVEMNIPVVRPEWVEGCEREGRIVGVREYYLNADPRLRQVGQGVRFQQQSQQSPTQQQPQQRTLPRTTSLDQNDQMARSERDTPQSTHNSRADVSIKEEATQRPLTPPTPPLKDHVHMTESSNHLSRATSNDNHRDGLSNGDQSTVVAPNRDENSQTDRPDESSKGNSNHNDEGDKGSLQLPRSPSVEQQKESRDADRGRSGDGDSFSEVTL